MFSLCYTGFDLWNNGARSASEVEDWGAKVPLWWPQLQLWRVFQIGAQFFQLCLNPGIKSNLGVIVSLGLWVNVCFCCVTISFVSTNLSAWLGRMSTKWPIFMSSGMRNLNSVDLLFFGKGSTIRCIFIVLEWGLDPKNKGTASITLSGLF